MVTPTHLLHKFEKKEKEKHWYGWVLPIHPQMLFQAIVFVCSFFLHI
jgi:hypothetical protein